MCVRCYPCHACDAPAGEPCDAGAMTLEKLMRPPYATDEEFHEARVVMWSLSER
jgi:hypothetical protein